MPVSVAEKVEPSVNDNAGWALGVGAMLPKVSGGGVFRLTVIVTAAVAVEPVASVTPTVTELVPAAVGVPLKLPVLPLKLTPAGRVPA